MCCRFHHGAGRYIRPGQKLHSSVVHGAQKTGSYEPKASLEKYEGRDIGLKSWSALSGIKMNDLPSYVERDLYDRARDLVDSYLSAYDRSHETDEIIDLVNKLGGMVSSSEHLHCSRLLIILKSLT